MESKADFLTRILSDEQCKSCLAKVGDRLNKEVLIKRQELIDKYDPNGAAATSKRKRGSSKGKQRTE